MLLEVIMLVGDGSLGLDNSVDSLNKNVYKSLDYVLFIGGSFLCLICIKKKRERKTNIQ